MTRIEVAVLALGGMLLQAACSSKDALLRTRDGGQGGEIASGAGGAAGSGTGGSVVVGSGGAAGLGGRGTTTGTGGGAGGEGGRSAAGTGGGATGGHTSPGTGGVAGTGGGGGAGVGGGLGTGGIGTGGTGGLGTGGIGTGGTPVPCSFVTTQAECETRSDCHSVFQDPHTCKCPTLGCCAQFSRCVDNDQARCTASPGLACGSATPYCEGEYVVAYTTTCFEGCVQSKDCAPSDSIPCGTTTCGPQQACVHPPVGGTCQMPDAGQCPNGTFAMGNPPCCLPPDKPTCVAIDKACTGTNVTCACFSVDPCNAHLTNACAASTIVGRDIQCRAG